MAENDVFASIGDLHEEAHAGEVINSHYGVIDYWSKTNEMRELCYDWRKGRHWTPDEEKEMRLLGKAPVVFHKSMASLRAVMGTFILNKYDVKPSPVEPSDQDISDILKARYNWHHYHHNVKMKDKSLMEKSLIGGDAWQESYMIVTPGSKPRMVVQNQNDFAIYPDPNSIDLVERRDCEFIDRDSWMTIRELMTNFPELANELRENLVYSGDREDETWETEKRYANRNHETETWKNGQYRVTERFYKVLKNQMWGVSGDGEDVNLGEDPTEETMNKARTEGFVLQKKPVEYLYIAIVCEQFSREKFLFNGPYHCQPRNPITEEIVFPLVQLVCEDVGGDTNGIIQYQIGPNKLINSMMSQELYNVKHEVNTGMIGNPNKFDENGKEDIALNHANGDRMFWIKPGETIDGAVAPLPHSANSSRNETIINWASKFQDEVSISNPSQQGISEGSNISGKLDQQRSEQAFTQQVGVTENYRHFLTQRARLWAFYDRKYFTDEETFRLIEKANPDDPDWLTINKPEKDQWGTIKKANDINSAVYDYIFEDSIQSPHMRDKIRQQIVQLKQNSAANPDPLINAYLDMYFLKMSDVDQNLKDYIYKHNAIVEQDQQQQRQAQAQAQEAEQKKAQGDMDVQDIQKQSMKIDNDTKTQDLAQKEAEQTLPNLEELIAGPIQQSTLAR